MPPAAHRSPTSASQAEVVLQPQLKNCLLNLPSPLVAALQNANTIAQNVVVELSYRVPAPAGPDGKVKSSGPAKSIYLGWTGMQSQSKATPIVGRNGINGGKGSAGRQDQEVATVELDATYGRLLGIANGQKVC